MARKNEDRANGGCALLLALLPFLATFLCGLIVVELRTEPVKLRDGGTTGFGLVIAYGLLPMLLAWGLNLTVFAALRPRLAGSSAGAVAIRQAIAGALVFGGLAIVLRLNDHLAAVALLVLPIAITYVIYRYFGGARGTLT